MIPDLKLKCEWEKIRVVYTHMFFNRNFHSSWNKGKTSRWNNAEILQENSNKNWNNRNNGLKIQKKLWRNIFKLTDTTDYTKAMPSSILSRSFFWHIRIDFVSYIFLISLPISLNRFSSACLALSNSSWSSLTDLSQRSTMAAKNTVEIEF